MTDEPGRRTAILRVPRSGPAGTPAAPALSRLFGDDPEVHERFLAEATRLLLPGGAVLFRQGEPGDHLYVVLHGRLHYLSSGDDGGARFVGEVGPGEMVGERSLISGQPRRATVRAIRDSEVLELSREGFDRLVARHPHAMMQVARTLTSRFTPGGQYHRRQPGVSTLAVVPLREGTPYLPLAQALASVLGRRGGTLTLRAREVDEHLGAGASQAGFADAGATRLTGWLQQREAEHRFVVYLGDPRPTDWTRRCVRQADRVLVVAEPDGDPGPGELDDFLARREVAGPSAGRELVLLTRRGTSVPAAPWLASRSVRAHHFVDPEDPADLRRLGRSLSGGAIGLVLSGGGARTLAHVGAVRAVREAAIPVDLVGGTSGGALFAAQVALGWDDATMARQNRKHFVDSGRLLDPSLPVLSLIRGRRFGRLLEAMLGEHRIEDLRLPYFCVSTNLSRGEQAVHSDGLLREWVQASLSVPGLGPPLLRDGELFVDGSVLDNLPIDTMRERTGGPVIAVNVGAERGPSADPTLPSLPSPWRVAWGRLRGRPASPRVPSIVDVLMGATMVGGVRASRRFESLADLVVRPDVSSVGHLDFAAMDRLVDEGYRAMAAALEGAGDGWMGEQE